MDSNLASTIKTQLEIDEGKGLDGLGHVYNDSQHIPTIGYGYNLHEPQHLSRIEELGYDSKEVLAGRQVISEEHVNQLLDESIATAVRDANIYLPGLEHYPPEVQSVIVNMSYNMGADKLEQFTGLREALVNHDYDAAAKELVDSKWHDQVGDRADRLVNLMESVTSPPVEPHAHADPVQPQIQVEPQYVAPPVEQPLPAVEDHHSTNAIPNPGEHPIEHPSQFSVGGGALFGDGGAIGLLSITQLVQETALSTVQEVKDLFASHPDEVAAQPTHSLFESANDASHSLMSMFSPANPTVEPSTPNIFESTQTTVDNARSHMSDMFTSPPPHPSRIH